MENNSDVIDKIIHGETYNTPDEIDPEFLQDFIAETNEHLECIGMDVLTLEAQPENEEILNSMFRSFHTIKGLAGFVDQELVQKIAHQTETLMDECRKRNIQADKTVIDLILRSSDFIKKLCDDLNISQNEEFISLVEIHLQELIKREQGGYKDQTPKGSMSLEQFKGKTPSVNGEYIRIPAYKADDMVNMVGELIIIQSLIEQEAMLRYGTNDAFIGNLLRMSRIIKEIQNHSMSLRMVSLKSTFQKIARIARDTISELGKDVDFHMIGEETEIDRGVAEKLLDPLVHLVKNCIYHGIEDADERARKNKPTRGRVEIQAYSRRGVVYIQIFDDGRGICVDSIRKKANEKGLLDTVCSYTESEILDMIFLPGFSTREVADNISGRGVGMDVVKTEVTKIGGRVEIENQLGVGCAFILKIPINLSIMDGTIIQISDSHYIIPTSNVKQILHPNPEQLISIKGKHTMVRIKDDVIPIIPIEEMINVHTNVEDQTRLLIVVELDDRLYSFPVSNVLGKREVVVKPLGDEFSGLNFISGASILGDGKVSLILDIENLIKVGGEH